MTLPFPWLHTERTLPDGLVPDAGLQSCARDRTRWTLFAHDMLTELAHLTNLKLIIPDYTIFTWYLDNESLRAMIDIPAPVIVSGDNLLKWNA